MATVSRVTNFEAQIDRNKASITTLDKAIQERLNNKFHFIVEGGKGNQKSCSKHHFDRDPDFQEEFSHIVSTEEFAEDDNDFSADVYDNNYLSMELAHPKRGEQEPKFSLVTKRLRDANGLPIVKAGYNPILNTSMEKVEDADGEKSAFSTNLISENMFEKKS